MTPARILVTGFEPFDDAVNASQVVVESLAHDPPEILRPIAARLDVDVLPVDTESIGGRVASILEDPPALWLLTGQDAARGRISVETRAVNNRSFASPDNAGRRVRDEPVVEGGPGELAVSIPEPASLVAALRARGIEAETSDDAGTYLCNQTLYLALHAGVETPAPAREAHPIVPIGFVHLPLLSEQAAARDNGAGGMPLDTMREALACILTRIAVG